jgi:hypothetical protein
MNVLQLGLNALIALPNRDGAEDTYCRVGIKRYVRAIEDEKLGRVSDMEMVRLEEVELASREKWLRENAAARSKRRRRGPLQSYKLPSAGLKTTKKQPQEQLTVRREAIANSTSNYPRSTSDLILSPDGNHLTSRFKD